MNARHIIKALLIVCLAISLLPAIVSAAPAHSSCSVTHVVQAGENLFRISLKYNVSMAAIMQANGLINPNYVYVGQVLCIPSGQVTPPPPPPPTGTRYCVQPGDTLGTIAARFGTTVYAIMQANGLSNPNYIYVGQWLNIPGACCPAPPAPPAPPPAGKWKGEYYDNPHLAGSAALVRYETAINFDWGAKSPAAKIPVDNFSARWTRTVYLNGGVYRFTMTVDDGGRLWVDDRLLIDQWDQHATATYTQDVTLGAGYHAIRMEYQEFTGSAMAMLSWVRVADGGGGQPSGAWLGQYYDTIDLAGTPVQRFDPAIDFDWGDGSPMPGLISDNLFSIRWTRNVLFDGGTYRFYALVDDGVRLYVDNRLVIDQWRDSNSITFFKEADITSGVHEVKVEYYEFGHQARITVWWEKLR